MINSAIIRRSDPKSMESMDLMADSNQMADLNQTAGCQTAADLNQTAADLNQMYGNCPQLYDGFVF